MDGGEKTHTSFSLGLRQQWREHCAGLCRNFDSFSALRYDRSNFPDSVL